MWYPAPARQSIPIITHHYFPLWLTPMDWVVSPKKCTPWLFWGSINGEGGSPLNYIRLGPRFLLALSHEHTLNTITMATAAAMVWSGTVVGTTINRRQTPQWTYMTLWCEGIFLEGLWTLFLGFLLRKWPLLIKMRQLHRPPHSTHNLLTLHTCP